MARRRMLSTNLGASRRFASVTGKLAEFSQALYMLLIPNTDDYGRLAGDAFTVKHSVWPTSPRSEKDFDQALQSLADAGLIQRYESDGETAIQIEKFEVNQSGLKKQVVSKFQEPPRKSWSRTENPSEQNRTEQKGIEQNGTAPDGATPPVPNSENADADFVSAEWNATVTVPIAKVRLSGVTADRRRKIAECCKLHPSRDDWRRVIAWINGQPWCRAAGTGEHRNWTASLDWLCGPGKFGKYLDQAEAAPASRAGPVGVPRDPVRDCDHTPTCETQNQCYSRLGRERDERLAAKLAKVSA